MATPLVISEEIPELQAKINEELFRFQEELKSEMSRAKMKLDVLIMLMENRKSKAEDIPQTTQSDGFLFTPPLEQDEAESEPVKSSYKPQPVNDEPEALFQQDKCKIELPMVSVDLELDNTLGDVQPINVFDEMPEPIVTENLLDIEVAKANHYLLAERSLSPTDSHEDLYNLSYKDDVLGVSDTDSLSSPNLGFTMQIFDPGTLAHSKQEAHHMLMKMDRLKVVRNLFDEVTPSFRAEVMNEQLMVFYNRGINFNYVPLFDLRGDIKCAMSSSVGTVPELFGNAHGTYSNVMEGIDRGKIVMKNDAYMVLEEMLYPNSLTLRETFSVVNAANEGFSSMLDTKQFQASETVTEWDKVLKGTCVTACTPAVFIFPKAENHMLDREGDWQNDVPKLLKNITSPSPTGLQPHSIFFSSIEDYYTNSTLRNTWGWAPNVDKTLLNELGGFYSTQNKGSGIGHQFLDEMLGPFTSKLEICGAPYRHLWLLVAEILKYLGYEGLAMKFLSKLKFELNISFWLGIITMFVFYPGAGATEGQWNAYVGLVNVKCNCVVMILGDSNILEGAMVDPKDAVTASLP